MTVRIDIGISDENRKKIADGLSRVLAESYMLYLKTHNFHWNVEGAMFNTLHSMFEKQYIEMAQAVDEIAERIRALGFYAQGSLSEYARFSSIQEATDLPIQDKEMISQLMEDQQTLVKTAREILPVVEKSNDQATLDLLTRRMEVHEKNAWMLRSLLN